MNFPATLCGRFQRTACFLTSLVVGMGGLVLVGWQWDLERIKSVFPGLVAMNPLTAACFILTAAVLICWGRQFANDRRRPGRLVLAGLVAGLGGLKFSEYLFGWESGIDQMIFRAKLGLSATGLPNRMAPNTALNFFLAGMALLLMEGKPAGCRPLSQYFSLAILLLSLLALTGYIFAASAFYQVTSFIPMALHTSLTFILLALALLFSQPECGFMAAVASPQTGGQIARRLLPVTVVIPIALGWLCLHVQQRAVYGLSFGLALLVLGIITVFAGMIWRLAASLNVADAKRQAAEERIRQLGQELQKRAGQLEASNQELEAFSYSVSHDLRAPIRHIDGFVDLLRKKSAANLDEKGLRYLGLIADSSRQMGNLIDDLLLFSRMGRAEMHEATVDLKQLVEDVIQTRLPEAAKLRVEWNLGPLPAVRGDEAMLRQVFINLLANALKYSSRQPTVKIEIGSRPEAPEQTAIFVRDNGVGFDMEYASKLFGVFQRLHRSEDFEGTGVGLANVKRIVTRHGGRVWAEGKVEAGATFYFTLPLVLPATIASTL